MALGPTNLGRGNLLTGIKPWQVRRKARQFTPYTPPAPPTGSFDPALNAALGSSNRGYQDLVADTGLANTRAASDYGIQLDQANHTYDTNTGLLRRSFAQLANRQQEGANAYGVMSGGALLQAAAKRAANQQLQQGQLDYGHQQQVDELGLNYTRGVTDRGTTLARAGRENRQYGIDTAAEKAYQATQAGYVAPGRGEPGGMPGNEFKDSKGTYRVQTVNGRKAKVRPNGTVEYLDHPLTGRRRGGSFGAGARGL